MVLKQIKFKFEFIQKLTLISFIILFLCSIIRHLLFQSNAYDLGWFDQFCYLISQGYPPIVSFSNYHLLADHVALIFYPLALLYKIYPSVYWLLFIQSLSLAVGAWVTWQFALDQGLSKVKANLVAIIYIFYPLIFNVNLYDFHPEVIALPLFILVIKFAQKDKIIGFTLGLMVIMACKAVLTLTVLFMGIWLFFFEQKKRCGAIAIAMGLAWFLLTTQVIIPAYLGQEHFAISRYGYLGDSISDILKNFIVKPHLLWGKVFSLDTLEYCLLLFLPILFLISLKQFHPLVAAIPALAMNILSTSDAQRNLVNHYAVPILPFLMIGIVYTLKTEKEWIKSHRFLIAWSMIGFFSLGKYGYFASNYLEFWDEIHFNREVIALIKTSEPVLAPSYLTPHLTHRQVISLPDQNLNREEILAYKYVILNTQYPGWKSSPEIMKNLWQKLDKNTNFQKAYQENNLSLFIQK